MFEPTRHDGVLQLASKDANWISSGWNGGITTANGAYNISVPDPWEYTDLESYAANRRHQAGFSTSGPTLFTGVSLDHAYSATDTPVTVVATVGLSNPTTYVDSTADPPNREPPGTVNLLIGIERTLPEHGLIEALCGAIEAKTLTLYQETGIPSTTTDAAITGCTATNNQSRYAGSATALGQAVRRCTRDAILASLHSHYPNNQYPQDQTDAEYGATITGNTTVTSITD